MQDPNNSQQNCLADREIQKVNWLSRSAAIRIALTMTLASLFVMMVWIIVLSQSRVGIAQADVCVYWVAPFPEGNNSNPGTSVQPWATLEKAAETVPDNYCTVWFKDGLYLGENKLGRRFTTPTEFKAINPYKAIFQHNNMVVNISGARNIILEGFQFRQSGPGDGKMVVKADRAGDLWAEDIVFRDNIFHDSYGDDLLKIHNGVRFATIENNVFYNQAANEQHIDANSVTDVVIQDNIFFNDFAGSGRVDTGTTKHFIIIKDSNGNDDGLLGSERITVRRNIFLNWQGGKETFVKTGNDGKPYYEAKDVLVENNLMIGNSLKEIDTAFGVRGAKNITFTNNTIVGDLPGSSYAFRIHLSGLNPLNRNIYFYNNIWSDPTGTMGADLSGSPNEFSDGDPAETINLVLDNNLYWNGGKTIPNGELVSPLVDDAHRVLANPRLNTDQSSIILPRWKGSTSTFFSGNRFIRQEFLRLVEQYGKIPPNSPAVGRANPAFMPFDDILKRPRLSLSADLGAYEDQLSLSGRSDLTNIWLRWTDYYAPNAADAIITYTVGTSVEQITVMTTTRAYTLADLIPYSVYKVVLTVRDFDDKVIFQSNEVAMITTDLRLYFPMVVKDAD